MEMIDIGTVAIIFFINSLVATLFMAALWQQSRKQFHGISLWLTSFALLTAAFVLISLRNVIPDIVSILIANTCLVVAAFILYLGLERFVACPSSQRHNYIILAIFVGLFTYFTFFQPDVAIRIVLLNLALMLMFLQSSWLMLRRVGTQLKSLSRATGILCLLFALAGCYRLILVLFIPAPGDFLDMNLWDATGLLISQILTIGLVLVLLLMVNHRALRNIFDQKEILIRSKVELEISNRDLTERKQAKEALRESEERWQFAIEGAGDGLWDWNVPVNQLYFSPRWKALLGYGDDEIGNTLDEWDKRLHPEDREHVYNELGRHFEGVAPVFMSEYRLLCKDGIYRWMLGRGKTITWTTEGQPLRVVGTQTDITDRKQAEEALLKSNNLLDRTIDQSPIAMWISDEKGTLIRINRACCELLNITEKEVLGKYNIFQDNIVEKYGFMPQVKSVFEEGKTVRFEIRYDTAELESLQLEGRAFVILDISIFPIIDTDGHIINAMIHQADITARKKSEESLRSEQLMLARTEGIANIGSWEWDIATDTVTWSDELFRIFQRDPQEGAPSFAEHPAFYHPDDMARLRQAAEAAVADGTPYELELRAIRKDGETRVCVARGAAEMAPGGRPVRLFGSLQDITDRKRVEENLEKSRQELRSLSMHLTSLREEERTLLAREIHDELGQALTALKMDLSWLSQKLPEGHGPLPGKIASMLKLVDTTVKTVKRLSTELRPGLLDDLGLVAAMEWQAGEFQERTGIKTELSFEPDDIMVDNDQATALFRIFQEVLTNVARHAAATRVDAYLRERDGVLELSVRDNGKGIEQTMINSSKSLGMIGMRERCHHLGGSVDIRGKPGKGTTVTVNLPAGEVRQ